MTVVASGCSRIAGPPIIAPAGRSSRVQTSDVSTAVLEPNPAGAQARSVERRAGSGENTEKSNAGRRPIAATRNDTIRVASPGNSRLNDAR